MTDLSIGDIIRATLGNPLDALAKADTLPAIPEQLEQQIRPPTPNELAVIESLAEKAAKLKDEISAAMGTKGSDLRKLTAELKDKMLSHGMKEVVIAGRPPIELTEKLTRKNTRKALVAAYQKVMIEKLGDEKKGMKEGKMKGLNMWNKIDQSIGHTLSIPDPSPPDVEPHY